jgi:hypothetical protein
MTYEQMFANIDKAEVVLVSGEEDNVYKPTPQGGGGTFTGLRETASVNKGEELRWVAKDVPAGNYVVKIAHDTAHPGGDADLYVKKNVQPTKRSYDCRPYKSGSSEICKINMAQPGSIMISVFGYSAGESWFTLTADPDVSR